MIHIADMFIKDITIPKKRGKCLIMHVILFWKDLEKLTKIGFHHEKPRKYWLSSYQLSVIQLLGYNQIIGPHQLLLSGL